MKHRVVGRGRCSGDATLGKLEGVKSQSQLEILYTLASVPQFSTTLKAGHSTINDSMFSSILHDKD